MDTNSRFRNTTYHSPIFIGHEPFFLRRIFYETHAHILEIYGVI